MEKWLAIGSLVLTMTFVWVVWDASHEEWHAYQKTYYRLVLDRAQNEAQREWARGQRMEVKQLEPKDVGGIERCMTCHLAVDNPAFEGAPEPFRKHSDLLESHPPQRFGCVVCHEGEGRAVTTLEAHGQGEIVAKPLLKGDYLQALCYNCHGEKTLPPEATKAVLRGRELMNRYLCLGCHKIDGEGGEEGPDLSTVGSRRNWLWLYAHLVRPQGVVVGSTMPVFALNREQIKDISIHLMTLLDSPDQMFNSTLGAKRKAESYEPGWLEGEDSKKKKDFPGGEAIGEFQYDGEALFRGAGCSLCHSIGIYGGDVGPPLTYIGRKREPENLEKLLRDPEQVLPGGKMPLLYLNELQVKALAAYLSTLN
jgi:cytochrome c2